MTTTRVCSLARRSQGSHSKFRLQPMSTRLAPYTGERPRGRHTRTHAEGRPRLMILNVRPHGYQRRGCVHHGKSRQIASIAPGCSLAEYVLPPWGVCMHSIVRAALYLTSDSTPQLQLSRRCTLPSSHRSLGPPHSICDVAWGAVRPACRMRSRDFNRSTVSFATRRRCPPARPAREGPVRDPASTRAGEQSTRSHLLYASWSPRTQRTMSQRHRYG